MYILNVSGVKYKCQEKPIRKNNLIVGVGETQVTAIDPLSGELVSTIDNINFRIEGTEGTVTLTDETGNSVEFDTEISKEEQDANFQFETDLRLTMLEIGLE